VARFCQFFKILVPLLFAISQMGCIVYYGPEGVQESPEALSGHIWDFLGPKVSVEIGLVGCAPRAAGPI